MVKFILSSLLIVHTLFSFTQIEGKWKIIDESGKARSIVEIYKKSDGKYYGKVIYSLEQESSLLTCVKCEGALKDQPIIGMDIIQGLEKNGDKFVGGEIIDPERGKTYKCRMKLDNDGNLEVRGYIGISLLGRTQTWLKEK